MGHFVRLNLEERFYEIIMSDLVLDEFGKIAVENIIKTEKLRCHEQQHLCDTRGIVLSIRIGK